MKRIAPRRRQLNQRFVWAFRQLSRALDRVVPKDPTSWVFALARPDQWGSNQQALYEYVRREHPELTPRVVRLFAYFPRSLSEWVDRWALLRAGVIVIHHGPSDFRYLCHHAPYFRRVIFNVWHGINTKGIGLQVSRDARDPAAVHADARYYSAVSASSAANQASLCSGLALERERVVVTGLPRNDWLTCPSAELPASLRRQRCQLVDELEGRRLVLYAPTFRAAARAGFYPFTPDQARRLEATLARHGAVLGLRPHINAKDFSCPSWALDVSARRYPETQVLLRETSLLITDYSGIWIDLLLRRCPMLLFCYDHDQYDAARGLIYDLDAIFPGPAARDFDGFVAALDPLLAETQGLDPERLERALQLFHRFTDSRASARVVEEITRLQRLSTCGPVAPTGSARRWRGATPATRRR